MWYLAQLLKEFDNNLLFALAGYNAGPGRPKSWAASFASQDVDCFVEDMPFEETRLYVKRVLGSYGAYCTLYGQ